MHATAKIFLSLSLAVILTGCVTLPDDPPFTTENQEPVSVTLIGTVVKNADGLLDASHILQTDEGENFPIASVAINLRKYEDKLVEAYGTTKEDGVLLVDKITRLGREDLTKQIYQNTDMGFRVNHPESWKINEKEHSVSFTPYPANDGESDDRVTMARHSNPDKKSVREWLGLD